MSDERVYEITNLSDPYTIKGADKAAPCSSCRPYLPSPRISTATQRAGETLMPILAFGGDPINWLLENMDILNLESYLDKNGGLLADCLDSVIIGSFEERREIEKKLTTAKCEEDREQILREWHDKRRTSMNDIGDTARKVTEIFRMQGD